MLKLRWKMKTMSQQTVWQESACCVYFSSWECGDHQWPWKFMLQASIISSFPEQEHNDESAKSYTYSHRKYDRELNVVLLLDMNTPQAVQLQKTLPVETCWWMIVCGFQGFIYLYICVYLYLFIYICVVLLFQKRGSWFLRRPSIKTFL